MESYNSHRLLYNVRLSPDEWQRLIHDMDGVVTGYQLRPEEVLALKSLEPLTVAKARAHPILAWTAVHLAAANMGLES